MPTANNPPAEVAVEDRVYEIISQVIDAIKGQLLENAQAIAIMGVNETAQLLRQAGINLSTQRQDVQKLVTKLVNDYANNLAKGGSMCVDRVVRQVTSTTAEITPKHVFVSWMDDLQKEVVQEVTNIITHDYAAGIHPYGTTEKLRDYLQKPKHRFEVAARTEAQKLRTDAKVRMMQENGVHYVRYITAGDDRVRPEHQLRNNKIYRMEDAPWLGEYNCRCTLVPADREVKRGATVTESATETVAIDNDATLPTIPIKMGYEGLIRKDNPVIPYTQFTSPKPPYPDIVEQSAYDNRGLPSEVYDYTGEDYDDINKYLRGESTLEGLTDTIAGIDNWVEGQVIAPKIHLRDIEPIKPKMITVDVPQIYRGISGKTNSMIIQALKKGGIDKVRSEFVGTEITDLAFQSWSLKEDVASTYGRYSGTIQLDGIPTEPHVILIEAVERGTPGRYIGSASRYPSEHEVLRPRGLTSVIDHIEIGERMKGGEVRVYVYTHLKRG